MFGCKEHNQSDFNVYHLVISMCRVFSCVAGKAHLLWPACSLGKTLLAFDLLRFVFQGQVSLLLQIALDFYFSILVPHNEKDIFFGVLVLEGLVCLHRPIQLQLLQHYSSGHRLGLPWYFCLAAAAKSLCSKGFQSTQLNCSDPFKLKGTWTQP